MEAAEQSSLRWVLVARNTTASWICGVLPPRGNLKRNFAGCKLNISASGPRPTFSFRHRIVLEGAEAVLDARNSVTGSARTHLLMWHVV